MLTLPQELIDKLDNKLDTTICFESDGKTILISAFSPEGQDCNIEIELNEGDTLTTLADEVYDRYEAFDVSEETYLWLDNTGHGTNGAPYELEDVLDDMKWQEKWILRVYNLINEQT